jgi:hypothetical protein
VNVVSEIACDAEALRAAVAAERERCARLCEEMAAALQADEANHPFGAAGRWLCAARADQARVLARRIRGEP